MPYNVGVCVCGGSVGSKYVERCELCPPGMLHFLVYNAGRRKYVTVATKALIDLFTLSQRRAGTIGVVVGVGRSHVEGTRGQTPLGGDTESQTRM